MIQTLKDQVSPKDFEKLQLAIVPNLIQADPNGAMIRLCMDPSMRSSTKIWQKAVFTLYEQDTGFANTWLIENLPKMDTRTAERISAYTSQVAVTDGNFEIARNWAGRIRDPIIRKQLMDQIAAHENQAVVPKN